MNAHSQAQEACGLLGWHFDQVVRVSLLGQRVWAAVTFQRVEMHARAHRGRGAVVEQFDLDLALATPCAGFRSPVTLSGVVLAGRANVASVDSLALFAGYSSRALLVDTRELSSELLVTAALLDVGIVTTAGGMALLAEAGPRVTGTQFTSHEWLLQETAYAAVLHEQDATRVG